MDDNYPKFNFDLGDIVINVFTTNYIFNGFENDMRPHNWSGQNTPRNYVDDETLPP